MPGHDGAQAFPPVAVQVVAVDVEVLQVAETGLWCPTCLLPSGIGVEGLVTFDGSPGWIQRFDICTDHGGPIGDG